MCKVVHDANHWHKRKKSRTHHRYKHTPIIDLHSVFILDARNTWPIACHILYNIVFFVWWHITSLVCSLVLSTVHQLACCIICDMHENHVNTMYIYANTHSVLYCNYRIVRLIRCCVMWDMGYQPWDESSCYMCNIIHHNKYIIWYCITLYHIILEGGAHIRRYTYIHRQIEVLYSVNRKTTCS